MLTILHNYLIIYILQFYKERSREKEISTDPFSWDGKQLLQSSRPPAQYMAVDLTVPSNKNTRPSTEHILSAKFAMCSPCFLHVSAVFLAEHPSAWPPLDRRRHKPGMPQSRPLPERSPSSARS